LVVVKGWNITRRDAGRGAIWCACPSVASDAEQRQQGYRVSYKYLLAILRTRKQSFRPPVDYARSPHQRRESMLMITLNHPSIPRSHYFSF